MLYGGCLGSVSRRLRLSLGLGVLGRWVFFLCFAFSGPFPAALVRPFKGAMSSRGCEVSRGCLFNVEERISSECGDDGGSWDPIRSGNRRGGCPLCGKMTSLLREDDVPVKGTTVSVIWCLVLGDSDSCLSGVRWIVWLFPPTSAVVVIFWYLGG